ncbi:MAG: hypothetical protein KAU95_03460, partial [Candidatus Aenigmarchaeota archaeon]|nr:hypothetical protein [Candidatus Aenigmarchaeota archaeon]
MEIENLLNTELKVTLESEGLVGEFLKYKPAFTLDAKEKKEIGVNISVGKNIDTKVFKGNLIIKTNKEERKIPITLIVLDKENPLFNMNVNVINKEIIHPSKIKVYFSILNFGKTKSLTANISYYIITQSTGETVLEESVLKNFSSELSGMKEYILSEKQEGSYYVQVVAKIGSTVLMGSDSFNYAVPFWTQQRTIP